MSTLRTNNLESLATGSSASVDSLIEDRAFRASTMSEMLSLTVQDTVAVRKLNSGGIYPVEAVYKYSASTLKSLHDGFIYHSPTVPAPSVEADLINYWAATGETDPSGSGVFVLQDNYIDLGHSGIPKVLDIEASAFQSSIVSSFLSSLPEDYDSTIHCNSGHKFLPEDVIVEIPSGAVLSLDGAQVAYMSGTYRVKRNGVLTSDLVDDDSLTTVASGHHTILELANYGTSGSSSAAGRAATISYRTPQPDDEEQGLVTAFLQFTKQPASDTWSLSMRPYKPGLAIENGYSQWTSGVSTSIGDVVRSTANWYTATTSGTTGATAPTTNSGTESDGAVTWELLLRPDSTRFALTERGRMSVGSNLVSTDTLTISAPLEESNSILSLRANDDGVCLIKGFPKNGAVTVDVPNIAFSDAGYTALTGEGGKTLIQFEQDSGGWKTKRVFDSVLSGATPSVQGVHSGRFNGASALTVTNFISTIADQEIQITNSGTGDVTLDGSFILEGSAASVTLTRFSVIVLRKLSAVTSNWVEVSRNIK